MTAAKLTVGANVVINGKPATVLAVGADAHRHGYIRLCYRYQSVGASLLEASVPAETQLEAA